MRSVVGGGLRLVAIGAAVGVGVSLMLFRLVGTLLFGVTPHDLSTYATVLTLLWDRDSPLLPRLAAGAAVGMAALGLVGYPLAAWLAKVQV